MIEIWQDEHPIISDELNKTFHEVRLMSDEKFRNWSEDIRVFVGKCWEQDGIPPQNGIPLDEVERELQRLSVYPTHGLLVRDGGTYERDVIAAAGGYGSCLRNIFTNMELRGDGNSDGLSIDDYLVTTATDTEAAHRTLRRWASHFERNVKRDSLFMYSPQLRMTDPISLGAETGLEWVKLFHALENKRIGFWVEATKKQPKNRELFLSAADLTVLKTARLIDRKQIENVLGSGASHYRLRKYDRSMRIFPTYFRLMRKSLVMSGSTFSPLVAKFLI